MATAVITSAAANHHFFSLMVELYATATETESMKPYIATIEKEYTYWMNGYTTIKIGTAAKKLVRLPDGTILNRYCDELFIPRQESWADEEAATIAATTIIKYNKKRVLAIFGNPHLSITTKRIQAFSKNFASDAPTIPLTIKHADSSLQSKKIVLDYFKAKKADHIFYMSDEILIGVMQATYELGLKIPRDVSILAISNGFIPGLFNPSITYVETSGYKLGKLAMKKMSDHLNGQTFSRVIIQPSVLVEGSSM